MANWDEAFYDSGVRYDEATVIPIILKPTHMRDLHIWLTVPFDDQHIGMAQLLAFTTNHLQRMAANNPVAFAALIAATTAALNGVSDAFTDDETKLGLRKARKQAKDDFRAGLAKSVGKIAVAVEAKFGEGAPEFVECFPHGRVVFSHCPDDEVENNLETLINGVTTHSAQLGAQVVTDATALLTGWTAVYTPSETSTGAKTTTETAKKNARAALQLQLFMNLLAIAKLFPRQPEQLDLYMQQSLLQPHTQSSPDSPTPPTPPGP